LQTRLRVVLLGLLLGVACGGDGNGATDPTQTATPRPTARASASPSPSPPQPETPGPEVLIVLNGTLIDGTGASPVPNAYVVVEGDRIASIGTGEPPVSRGGTIINARRGTIMPGLIDTHVHVARGIFAGEDGTIEPGGLLPWLSAGMTTLRDVATPSGAFPEVKRIADEQTTAHEAPRVVWAGPLVTAVGGYPFPVPRYAAVGEDVGSIDEARQVVTSLADGGAGVIKLGLEQGYYANLGWPLLSLDVVRAITETAHARGLRVTAHVTSVDEVRLALDGGVDDLAHAPLEPIPDEMMQEMLNRGTGMATTATVWGVASASVQAAANAKRYADAGGVVSVATDYGCCGQAAGLPPYLQEMQFLRGAGMTPMQLLVAATRSGAIMANVGQQVGTLEAGKIADIIVVDGDPLSELQALNHVSVVVQGGAVVVSR
jgi:imidazolonepropionase-like amidohydrolase